MSAWRKTVLSVSPTRIQNFSKELEENIKKQSASKRYKSKKSKHKSHGTKEKPPLKKVRKSQSSKSKSKEKRSRKIRKKEESPPPVLLPADYEPDGLDLEKEFFSLIKYVKERGTLLEHMFSIVDDEKIIEMLPLTLKEKPLVDIKSKLSQQLQIISTQRLECILKGEELDFSSGTDTSDQNDQQPSTSKMISEDVVENSNNILQTNEVDSTTSDINATAALTLSTAHTQSISCDQDVGGTQSPDYVESESVIVDVTEDEYELTSDYEEMVDELLEGTLETANANQNKIKTQMPTKKQSPVKKPSGIPEKQPRVKKSPKDVVRSRTEILELEMRARAIRSLMKNVANNIKSSL